MVVYLIPTERPSEGLLAWNDMPTCFADAGSGARHDYPASFGTSTSRVSSCERLRQYIDAARRHRLIGQRYRIASRGMIGVAMVYHATQNTIVATAKIVSIRFMWAISRQRGSRMDSYPSPRYMKLPARSCDASLARDSKKATLDLPLYGATP